MARDRESGYALLLVFLMAAILAIALYSEIPRVAFQAQRQKEQLLMARGLEYIRGFQVYQQTVRQFPQRIEDLETFQSRHFVRHKYVDPLTGKSDWRLIHMVNGILTDSVVTKPPEGGQQPAQNTFIIPTAGVSGVGDAQGQGGTGAPLRRRASEGGAGSGSDGQLPPIPGPPPDSAGGGPGTTGDQTTQTQTYPPYPPPPAPGSPPDQGSRPSPAPTLPGNNPAGALINQLLTQPRQGVAGAAGMAGLTGIVGVASKVKAEGIMVYNDRDAYNEWEFIYDPSKMPMMQGLGGGSTPTAPGGQGVTTGLPGLFGSGTQSQSGAGGQTGGARQPISSFSSAGPGQTAVTGQSGTPTGTPGMQNPASTAGGFPPGYRPGRR